MTSTTSPTPSVDGKVSFGGQRIPELDGLRGIAILSVLVFHYFAIEGAGRLPAAVQAIGDFGWTGVDLFFVLSGFLIGGILLDARDAKSYFSTFYIRRACRILPVYFALCALAAFIYFSNVTDGTAAHRWLYEERLPWYAYVTFAQNVFMAKAGAMSSRMIDATWSLAIEEQFYLSFPLVIRFAPKRLLPWLIGAGVVIAPGIRAVLGCLLAPGHRAIAVYVLMPCRADALLIGVLVAWAMREAACRAWLIRHHRILYLPLLGFGFGFVALIVNRWGLTSGHLATWGYSAIALFFGAMLALAVTRPSGWLAWFLRRRLLIAAGTIAYGLYLFHQPVLGLTHFAIRGATPTLVDVYAVETTLIAVAALVILCSVSWTWFERPFIRLGHRWQYGPTTIDDRGSSG